MVRYPYISKHTDMLSHHLEKGKIADLVPICIGIGGIAILFVINTPFNEAAPHIIHIVMLTAEVIISRMDM